MRDAAQTVFNGVDRLMDQRLREVKLQPCTAHIHLPTLYYTSLDHISTVSLASATCHMSRERKYRPTDFCCLEILS